MRKMFRWLRKSERGQSATEYMLVIAVVVLALVAVASKLIPKFEAGVDELAGNIETTLGVMPAMETPGGGG
jgi:Flp pilus assembly pilin Flp